jgi:hypothetical protein
MHISTLMDLSLNPFIAAAVFGATIVTDAVYVFFTAAVMARHRIRAANWSAIWYLLSAFAVINYTATRSTSYSQRWVRGSALMCRSPG